MINEKDLLLFINEMKFTSTQPAGTHGWYCDNDGWSRARYEIIQKIKELSDEGYWKGFEFDGMVGNRKIYSSWECNKCGYVDETFSPKIWCPNCGRNMVGVEE